MLSGWPGGGTRHWLAASALPAPGAGKASDPLAAAGGVTGRILFRSGVRRMFRQRRRRNRRARGIVLEHVQDDMHAAADHDERRRRRRRKACAAAATALSTAPTPISSRSHLLRSGGAAAAACAALRAAAMIIRAFRRGSARRRLAVVHRGFRRRDPIGRRRCGARPKRSSQLGRERRSGCGAGLQRMVRRQVRIERRPRSGGDHAARRGLEGCGFDGGRMARRLGR